MIKGFIFDLDGVLVDTAKFHFKAWKRLAHSLDIDFSEKQNEHLKGIGREESLKKILEWGNKTVSDDEFENLMLQKNEWYLEMVNTMKEGDTLPGVNKFLQGTRKLNLKTALGSASKNAKTILEHVNLTNFFDAIIDGTQTTKSKPNPQVFEMAAEALQLEPTSLVVFEDSLAGIEAANNGGFRCVGIGNKKVLKKADVVYHNLEQLSPVVIINQLNFKS